MTMLLFFFFLAVGGGGAGRKGVKKVWNIGKIFHIKSFLCY